jgi:hypothetical protein
MRTEGVLNSRVTDHFLLLPLLALTLRGPSGGHCVGLSFRLRRTLVRASSGPSGPLLAIEVGDWSYLKLHAVAPGGPPEGQCKNEVSV